MWNRKSVRLLALLALAGTAATNAFAYIDPGTGMSFVSGIGAFIAGFFAIAFGAIVVTFKRWTAYLKALFSKKPRP